MSQKNEIQIREYSPSDYHQVRDIYFKGCFEMFPISIKMILKGENPKTSLLHLSVLISSIFISFAISLEAGLILFLTFEATAIAGIYDLYVNNPKRVLKRIMQDKEMRSLTTKPNRLWVATTTKTETETETKENENEKDSEICGLITILKLSDEKFEFQRLFVKPEFRRLGAATKLIETVISESKKMNGKILLLKTTNVRKNAAKLYNKLGFEKIKSYRTSIGFMQYLPPVITGIHSNDYILKLEK